MAIKKSFKKGADALFDPDSSNGTQRKGTSSKHGNQGKQGRPKSNFKEITKTSQIGTKENEIRATFIVDETQLEKIKAFAFWYRSSIKNVFHEAIEDYVAKHKSDLSKALSIYRREAAE